MHGRCHPPAVTSGIHARLTVGLDPVVDLRPDSLRRVLAALLELGMRPRLPVDPYDFADPEIREQWRTERNLTVFSMYDPDDPFREVDLFAQDPLPFAELVAQATIVHVEGVPVPVASVDHLITMKRAVGRPRDLEDVAALERLRAER